MNAIDLIKSERERQIEQWGNAHDDQEHQLGCLGVIAAAILVKGTDATVRDPLERVDEDGLDTFGILRKHKDNRVTQLTVAGALAAAELDRELRRVAREERAHSPEGLLLAQFHKVWGCNRDGVYDKAEWVKLQTYLGALVEKAK
jgi:hypothetical protein